MKNSSLKFVLSFICLFVRGEIFCQDTLITLPSQKEISGKLKFKIEKTSNMFVYYYEISNEWNSHQNIYEYFLETDARVDSIYSPVMWAGEISEVRKRIVSWSSSDSLFDVSPGKNLPGFIIYSTGLPYITKFYFRGFPKSFVVPEGQAPSLSQIENRDVFENSFRGFSISPSEALKSLDDYSFIDTLMNSGIISFVNGWIKRESIKDKYQAYLSESKTSLQQNNNPLARYYLKNILRDVDIDSTAEITSEAYALLKYNVEYLLEKIKE